MDKEFHVILSFKDELMIVPLWEKWKINEKRYNDLKHQFDKFKNYKKVMD